MPAMQTISPRCTLKETLLTTGLPCFLLLTVRFCTVSTLSPGLSGVFSMMSCTLRPTIISLSSSLLVLATSTVPTYLPLRSTVQRSATALISSSLWVMKRMDLPSLVSSFIIFISSSISCGVSTAVGSSKMSTSLSRYSILRISVRCCMPTVISSTIASGSTLRP